jgi:Tol biopolymer transport system component/DNA-binding beta-propeller fold protein YncE
VRVPVDFRYRDGMSVIAALVFLLFSAASQIPATSTAYDDMWPAWSPDGRRIVFVSTRDGDPEIYVMDADGSNARRLTRTPGRDAHPSWSPDQRRIAFQSPRENGHTRIFSMDPDGSNLRAVTTNEGFCGVPAWSPDSQRIAVQCTADLSRVATDRPWKLFVVPAAGGPMRQVTNGPGSDQVPHWSPDGRRLLFYSDRSSVDQLYTIHVDDGATTQVTRGDAANRAASWMPDGRSILLQSEANGVPSDVHRLDVATGAMTRLTTSRPQHGAAYASADGRTIAFQARMGAFWRIWLMNADGSDHRPLGAPVRTAPDDPLILVSLSAENAVAFISPVTGAFMGTVPVASDPHEIAVSRDRARAFVATTGGRIVGPQSNPAVVTMIEIAPRQASFLRLNHCSRPHDVRVSSDGTLLWAACAPTHTVVELDVTTGRQRRDWVTGADGGWFVAVTPEGHKAYVPHLEGKRVTVIDRVRGTVAFVLEGGAQSGIDISPDGRTAWIVDHEQRRINVVETATDRVTAVVPLDSADFGRVRFTRDGIRVLLGQGRRIQIFDAATRAPLGRIDLTHDGKVIDVAPDGRRAVVSHPDANRISIVDLDTRETISVIQVGRVPDGVAWVK